MRKFLKNLLFVGVALLSLSLQSCFEKIDYGYEGVKVALYGSKDGNDAKLLKNGITWYNPFTTQIYEYPVFVQTVDYEPFTVNAKDGGSFLVDPTISLKVIDGKTPEVVKKYRKDNIEDVINTTLYNYVKNAFRIELNRYTTDELVSKREEFERSIETRLSSELAAEYFQLEQMTSGLQYPQSLKNSIEAKNEAVQKSIQISNEVAAVKAEAEKQIAKAEGEAKAMKIKGDAEAEYNRKIAASLSTLIIQQRMVEKWDGQLPVVTDGNTLLDVGKIVK